MLKNTLFFFFFVLVFSQVNAQDFLIQDGVTENTCSGTFMIRVMRVEIFQIMKIWFIPFVRMTQTMMV